MNNLYSRNGLLFWSEEEIEFRQLCQTTIVRAVTECLKTMNRGFEVVQVEAPLLTPRELLNPNYTDEDVWACEDGLVLRPETTMGSFAALPHLLDSHASRRRRMPICVWQHGKSFRREQDQPTKFMRLKEFYQLEFQCAFNPTTGKDYSEDLIPVVRDTLAYLIGRSCRTEPSDRLPSYAEWTTDVVCEDNDMEVCSISLRKDMLPTAKVLEVAVGTDRLIYNRFR